jgi:hypothetical protein
MKVCPSDLEPNLLLNEVDIPRTYGVVALYMEILDLSKWTLVDPKRDLLCHSLCVPIILSWEVYLCWNISKGKGCRWRCAKCSLERSSSWR